MSNLDSAISSKLPGQVVEMLLTSNDVTGVVAGKPMVSVYDRFRQGAGANLGLTAAQVEQVIAWAKDARETRAAIEADRALYRSTRGKHGSLHVGR